MLLTGRIIIGILFCFSLGLYSAGSKTSDKLIIYFPIIEILFFKINYLHFIYNFICIICNFILLIPPLIEYLNILNQTFILSIKNITNFFLISFLTFLF